TRLTEAPFIVSHLWTHRHSANLLRPHRPPPRTIPCRSPAGSLLLRGAPTTPDGPFGFAAQYLRLQPIMGVPGAAPRLVCRRHLLAVAIKWLQRSVQLGAGLLRLSLSVQRQ